jgi:hypothetical protein
MKVISLLIALVLSIQVYSQDDPSRGCYTNDIKEQDSLGHVFTKMNIYPSFKGGPKALHKFLNEKVSTKALLTALPDSVKLFRDSVVLKFAVSKYNRLSNLSVLQANNPDWKKEAMRLILLSCGLWEPGIDSGGANRSTWTTVVIYFSIDRRKEKPVVEVSGKSLSL